MFAELRIHSDLQNEKFKHKESFSLLLINLSLFKNHCKNENKTLLLTENKLKLKEVVEKRRKFVFHNNCT